MELFRVEYELNRLHCKYFGHEQCSSNYKYGPYLRGEYIFHYILSGKGKYTCNGQTFMLHQGQGFLIRPNDETMYCADGKEPWEYFWINLGGDADDLFSFINLDAQHLIYSSNHSSVLTAEIYSIIEKLKEEDTSTYRKMSLLFYTLHLLSIYAEENTQKTMLSPIQRACDIIESRLSYPHRVGELAKEVGLARGTFTEMFKSEKGMSPKQYIVKSKFDKATAYLRETDMSVSSISNSLGFSTVVEFSKQFKNYYGITPSQARKEMQMKLQQKNEQQVDTEQMLGEKGHNDD